MKIKGFHGNADTLRGVIRKQVYQHPIGCRYDTLVLTVCISIYTVILLPENKINAHV